ncbi:ribonuclease HII [Marinospirillum sp.]|uniref:ribonuclease HII n=1 Tax=Marinospirillum sp. TaxID=2183934 RepID=UPI00286FB7AA|nr:ribonuclease HII [Marinospirillum sp.]MDR9468824.1 ribonuclease HII [Marinospirillum sp.]
MVKTALPELQAEEIPYSGSLLAGVDEVGRGPLVGSVVAAAVILDPGQPIAGLMDSKKLSDKKRQALAVEIREKSLAWAVAEATAVEIDHLNILQASLLAMQRALDGLQPQAEFVLVDGKQLPPQLQQPALAVIQGDARHAAISAASIIAKVHRDQQLLDLHQQHPDYGFDRHKGYPTQAHIQALQLLGPLPEHRRSFKPVQKVMALLSTRPEPSAQG